MVWAYGPLFMASEKGCGTISRYGDDWDVVLGGVGAMASETPIARAGEGAISNRGWGICGGGGCDGNAVLGGCGAAAALWVVLDSLRANGFRGGFGE